MRSRAGFLVLLLAGCTPAEPKSVTPGPLADPSAGGPSASIAEGGAPRACVHDAKDVTPCNEDCDRGIAFACTVVAGRAERGDGVPKNATRAVVLHERACELRDASSCVTAARMHASGSGVPPNRGKQVELLAAACKLGDGAACAVSAKALANGAGVPRDDRRAVELWLLGCAVGNAAACEVVEPEAH